MAKKTGKKNNASSLQERKEMLQDLDSKMEELKASTAQMREDL